jgi:excisionase family DNA binding protein
VKIGAGASETRKGHAGALSARESGLPLYLTAADAATLLRTTTTAVYAMVARAQLPGVTRIGRRVLVRTDVLLDWLDQNRAPSPRSRR